MFYYTFNWTQILYNSQRITSLCPLVVIVARTFNACKIRHKIQKILPKYKSAEK